MAKILGGEFPVRKLTKDYTVTVTVIFTPEFRDRTAIAVFLFRLGAMVLGCKFKLEEPED